MIAASPAIQAMRAEVGTKAPVPSTGTEASAASTTQNTPPGPRPRRATTSVPPSASHSHGSMMNTESP